MSTAEQMAGKMPALPAFRTFIAIELTAEVRARVAQHIACLRHELPDVRASWSREDNLHLTLKFLGNVSVADIPKVSDAVERATKPMPAFEVTVSGCGLFPPRGRPSVLWLGTQAASLQALHAIIDQELDAAGFPGESRPFRPHLTIARLRQSQSARHLADLHNSMEFAPIAFPASQVVVFRSELLTQGSQHTAISRHRLA